MGYNIDTTKGTIPKKESEKKTMKDKNGIEIKKGDKVMITGAYFKSDNGLWIVEHAPGDDGWYGNDYCLHRLNKNGTESKAKNNIAFWPLFVTVSGYWKRLEAKAHNAEHAQIEVIA